MSEFSTPISNFFRLDGKVALITGGSRGIGLHTATAYLLSGCSLIILTARKPAGLTTALASLSALSAAHPTTITGRVIALPCDVSSYDSLQTLLTQVKEHTDRVDILVANAGATWGGPFETTPDWSGKKVLDLNVRGVFNLVQVFLPLLREGGRMGRVREGERDVKRKNESGLWVSEKERNRVGGPARVIVVSSVAGRTVPHTGANGTIMYAASKAAATHLAHQFAIELAPNNITSNIVSPGFFPSKLANGLIENLGGRESLERDNPIGRLGIADDIGGVMVFLASHAAAYVNGVEIVVDGGVHWKREGARL